MAKVKNPLFSMDASGPLGKAISFVKRKVGSVAIKRPQPPDARTPAQLSWRNMYQQCSALWHTLSEAEKAIWESLARPLHMTGFAYWQSQCLRPNPGIYLPLAGGHLTGSVTLEPGLTLDTVDLSAHAIDPSAHHPEEVPEARPKYGATELLGVPGVSFFGQSWLSLSANSLYYYSFEVRTPITVSAISLEVLGGVTGKAVRVGIYRADKDWQPTSLVSDAGTLSVNDVAVVSLTGLSIALQEGRYLIALHSESTPILRACLGATQYRGASFGVNTAIRDLCVPKTYSVLSDPGTPWTIITASTDGLLYLALLIFTP